jgi:hypothetical protein
VRGSASLKHARHLILSPAYEDTGSKLCCDTVWPEEAVLCWCVSYL